MKIKYILISITFLIALSSCSSVRKSQIANQTDVEVNTDELKKETINSTTTTKTKVVETAGNTITIEFDSTKKDSVFEIIVTPTKPSDYFNNSPSLKIQSSSKPKKITITSNTIKEDTKATTTNVSKEKEEAIKEEIKIASKETGKTKTKITFQWWWLLLIGAAILIFINRKRIWDGFAAIISPINRI